MIDIKKELVKYKPMDEGKYMKYDDVTSNLLSSFSKIVERFGKDQYRTLNHMDDILMAIEDKRGLEKIVEDMEDKISFMKGTEIKLLEAIVEVCDLTENMYIYSLRSNDSNLRSQMELQWKTLQHSLLKCGIVRFGNSGDIFDKQLHVAVESRESLDFSNIQIIEVIKSGYMYKDQLLNRAEVVITKLRCPLPL